MKNLFLLLIISIPLVSNAQICETGVGNIFNATLLLTDSAVSPLGPGESFIAMADDYCVGESTGTSPGATATPLTIWGQDALSPIRNGLQDGETFEIFLKTAAGTIPLPMENDAIYTISSASMDTVLSAVLDQLTTEINTLSISLDSLKFIADTQLARADSLQGLVDNFPDTVSQLQSDLAAANTTISSLSLDISTGETRIAGLLTQIRNMINTIRQ